MLGCEEKQRKMNNGCATGILIDISNVDVPTKSAIPASKVETASPFSWLGSLVLSNDMYAKGFSENNVSVPDDHCLKIIDSKDRRDNRSDHFGVKMEVDSELLEDETFDFDEGANSPNVSGCSDHESIIPYVLNDVHKFTEPDKQDRTLSSEQIAEVFKEATVVAVKLENYVHELNKTPLKSPNLTALLVERSAQKKQRIMEEQQIFQLKLEQEMNLKVDSKPKVDPNERAVQQMQLVHEVDAELEPEVKLEEEFKKGQVMPESPWSTKHVIGPSRLVDSFKNPYPLPHRKPSMTTDGISVPSLRKTSASASNSSASFSKLLQQNKSRSSMMSPQKNGPIKATVMAAPKQLKLAERPSPSLTNPPTLLRNSCSEMNQRKTPPTVTRANSFNAGSKIPTRPVLKRRNSTISPIVVESKLPTLAGSGGYKPANRRSIGDPSTPSRSTSFTPLKNFRHLQVASSPGPSSGTNDTKRSRLPNFSISKKFKGNDC